jgi:hypothetical protein
MSRPRPIGLAATLAALLTLASSGAAAAGELAGVTMSEHARVGEQSLVLNGMALRSRAMFKVYVAGLYLPERQGDWQQVLAADQPRQLVMHWLRSVDKATICQGWQEGLKVNAPDAPAEVSKAFDTLCEWMADARTGDRFTFTYLPEKGTTVVVQGKTRGTLAGKAFADALFASWIGPRPGPGELFRAGLMGKG